MFKSITTITKILFGVTVALAGATTVSALKDRKASKCCCDNCECECTEAEAECEETED